jgi:hypothetical protein
MKRNKRGSDYPDSKFDIQQLKAGTEVELEHTDDREIAKSIAKDHLHEIPDYYTRLLNMEQDALGNGEIKRIKKLAGLND